MLCIHCIFKENHVLCIHCILKENHDRQSSVRLWTNSRMMQKEKLQECSVLEIFFEKVLTEYTDDKLNMKVAEDKLDKNVVAGIGYYIVFVSNHDGKFLVEHA